ncbi:MAG: NAD-dependent epimerase/dehydratase family protein [Pyrinomonadaceae bacterium]
MNVLVTGATGFTGSYVVPLLLRQGARVRCLVRAGSDTSRLAVDQVELVEGDLNDQASLERALRDADALVNIASLGFGHAPNIVNAAVAAGTRRAVFISTTAIFTTLNAPSKSVRLAAEETIRASGLAYTILRPTMIYGSSRDRNMCRLIAYLRRWPAIPVFGRGEHLQQPVYVEDLATAIVQSLTSERAVGRAYNVSGAAPLTYNQVIDTVCEALGRRVRKVRLPLAPLVATLNAVERLPLRLPVKAEQIMRLNEDKAFDSSAAIEDFGYRPRSFAEGIRLELEEMGIKAEAAR